MINFEKISLKGFKSFAQRTEIYVPQGIMAIVGPNGCGKSNIADAIRWVLGEQSAKSLRGGKMEDVIFNGASGKRPSGYAEVSLHFQNTNGDLPLSYRELTITRRLYRTGDSEYSINKTNCRLKDIVALFADMGVGKNTYSILEQGKVDFILNSKPEDKRSLFDNAAGIYKYKIRKAEALKKLERTRDNLLRINDLHSEVSKRLRSLKRQVRKARRYKKAGEELKKKRLIFSGTKYMNFRKRLGECENFLEEATRIETEKTSEVNLLENELESVTLEFEELERVQNDYRREYHKLKRDIEMRETDIIYKKRRIEDIEDSERRERDELQTMQEELAEQKRLLIDGVKALKELKRKLEEVRSESEEIQRKITEEKVRIRDVEEKIEDLKAVLLGKESELAESRNNMNEMKARMNAVKRDIEKSEKERRLLNEETVHLNNSREEKEREYQELLAREETVRGEKEELWEKIADKEEERDEAAAMLNEVQAKLQAAKSRKDSLEEIRRKMEGIGPGVRALLKKSNLQGIVGILGDSIEVDPRFEKAIEVILEDRIYTILLRDRENVFEAIEFLKQKNLGRSTFLWRKAVSGLPEEPASHEELSNEPGVIDSACKFVSAKENFREHVKRLLQDVIIVEDIETALNLRERKNGNLTFLTVEGEVIRSDGSLTAGKISAEDFGYLAQKRRIKELKAEIQNADSAAVQIEARKEGIESVLHDLNDLFNSKEQELRNFQIKKVEIEKDSAHIDKIIESLETRKQNYNLTLEMLEEEKNECSRCAKSQEDAVESLMEEKNDITERMNELNRKTESDRRLIEELREEETAKKVVLASLEEKIDSTGKEKREGERRLEYLEHKIKQRHKTEQDRVEDKKNLEMEIIQIKEKNKDAVQKLDELEEIKRKNSDELTKREDKIIENKRRLKTAKKEWEKVFNDLQEKKVRKAEQQAKVDNISEQIRMEFGSQPEELFKGMEASEESLEEIAEQIEDLKSKMERIGDVNLGAIDEYNEVNERHEFLTQQKTDLEESLENLQKTVARINRTTISKFKETFEAVRANFREVFQRLFNGGEADLILSDEKNLLESGVDIVAMPPGKKLQYLSLMSGGEKALTALALLFALINYRPSPFLMFDEVDAPLDESNVDRFVNYVQELSDYSQVILITHNQMTMKSADVLYGITMSEPGISKLLSVKLRERARTREPAAELA